MSDNYTFYLITGIPMLRSQLKCKIKCQIFDWSYTGCVTTCTNIDEKALNEKTTRGQFF